VSPTCVDGTEADCMAGGLQWNGTQCCGSSNQTLICTDGDGSDCQGTGLHWTGTRCCVDSPQIEPRQCVAGTASACRALTGALWTGQMCCVGRAETCSPWTQGQCINSNGYWTGVDCCLPLEHRA